MQENEVVGMVVSLGMNDTSFKEGLSNLNRGMRVVQSEFQAAVGNVKTFGDSLDGLRANSDRLSKSISIQEKIVSAYRDKLDKSKQTLEQNIKSQNELEQQLKQIRVQYDESVNSLGRNDEATLKLKETMESLEKRYNTGTEKIKNNMKAIDNNTISLNNSEAKLKSMQKELKDTSKKIEEFGDEVKKSDDEVKKANAGLGTLNVAFGTLVADGVRKAIGALGDFITTGLELNSNLQEVENVIDAVFGEKGTQRVNDFAKSARDDFGLAELQVKQFTGTMGAMLDSAGIASNRALDMSMNFTKLSGDMASFFNSSPEKVFQDLTSAMAGSSETMLKYGINMNVANLEQFAMNKGIRQSWQEMSQAEQQMLRYQYIMDKTGKAQGDFAKTSDSHANQQRLLKLRLEETSAALAEKLLPIMTNMTETFVDFLDNNQDSIENIAKLIAMVANAVSIMFAVLASVPPEFYMIFGTIMLGITIFNQITTAINSTAGAVKLVTGAFEAGANPILKWTIIITGAVAAITLLVAALNVLFGKSDDMTRTMNSMSSTLGDMTNQVNTSMSNVKVPGYQAGTKYHTGGLALVGERGPEIVSLPRGSSVTTNGQTQQVMKGNGGATYNLNNVTINSNNAEDLFNQIQILVRRGAVI